MVKKYFEFINESLDLLLESNVVYSDRFRGVISRIEHPLSKNIMSMENKDLPVVSNYLDIDLKSNDTITFIPDRKAQEILGDKKELVRFTGNTGGWLTNNVVQNGTLFDLLGYKPLGDAPYKPSHADIGEVMKRVVSPTSGKTFVWVKFPDGEGVYNAQKLAPINPATSKEVWTKSRQEVKIGRLVRSLLKSSGIDVLPKDIETFVNLYKSAIDKLNNKFASFEVVTGDQVAHYYFYTNYYKRAGTLGSSCMSAAPPKWLEIYTSNPEVVGLVIYKAIEDPTKIIARALLWTLPDGKKFMDRIYTVNDSDVQLFRDFAKENGWYSKWYNNSTDNSKSFAPDGSIVEHLNLTVTLSKKSYNNFPYLDTLKYFVNGEGILSNNTNQKGEIYVLEDTGGSWVGECDVCGGSGRIDCGECDGDGSTRCDNCHGDGVIKCSECRGKGKVECDDCGGTGKEDDGEKECLECDGTGKVDCGNCRGEGSEECDECDGSGRYTCGECGGDGQVDCYECQ